MQDKDKRICKKCMYYKDGFCHRFPPHPHYGFPKVNEDDWCGEFTESYTDPSTLMDLMKNLLGEDAKDIL